MPAATSDVTVSTVRRRVRWAIWWVLLALWTIGLLLPFTADVPWRLESMDLSVRKIVSKSLHFSAYTILVLLAAWAGLSPRWRWLLVFFIMFHTGATEWIQANYIPGRGGSLSDVLLDQCGIALGFILSWRAWVQ